MEAKEERSAKPRRSDRRVKSSMSLDAAAASKPDAADRTDYVSAKAMPEFLSSAVFGIDFQKFLLGSHTPLGNFVKMCLRQKMMMDNSYSSSPC